MLFYTQKEEQEIKARQIDFLFLKIIVTGCFILLTTRLWFLQIRHGDELKNFSNINRFKQQALLAPRGLMLDRNGKILVKNAATAQLKINLNETEDLETVLKKIAPIINWSEKKIKKRIEKNKKRYGIFHPIVITSHLNLREIHELKMLHWLHPEIYVEEGGARVYPLKENGSQIFGFAGQASQEDLKDLKNVKKGELTGKAGLEKTYNKYLKGENGIAVIEVDAHNRISTDTPLPFQLLNRKVRQGQNLSLTIDRDIQTAAFKAFQRTDAIGPRQGAVIVMKSNGEILAWVSSPGFDGNVFSSEISKSFWRQFILENKKSFINKGLQEHYSPGSAFKPFVALAALQEKIITEDTLIHSPAVFQLGRKVFHDHSRLGYGNINLETALEKSSNTFFYQVGLKLGVEKLAKYARLFRFGRKTNIELPGEVPGLVPTPQWKKKAIGQTWQEGETLTFAIGQGALLVTLLQLTVAYNIIATEGLVVQPFLVKRITGGRVQQPTTLDTLTDRLDRQHFKAVKKGLRKVVQGAGGTARWWNLPEMPFSGKTGTAQVISFSSEKIFKKCRRLPREQRHHGLFISFMPSNSPEIIISVLTEHSCHGSTGSVPVARDIIRAYYKKYKNREVVN